MTGLDGVVGEGCVIAAGSGLRRPGQGVGGSALSRGRSCSGSCLQANLSSSNAHPRRRRGTCVPKHLCAQACACACVRVCVSAHPNGGMLV